mgnify:CR=1 FL=1
MNKLFYFQFTSSLTFIKNSACVEYFLFFFLKGKTGPDKLIHTLYPHCLFVSCCDGNDAVPAYKMAGWGYRKPSGITRTI